MDAKDDTVSQKWPNDLAKKSLGLRRETWKSIKRNLGCFEARGVPWMRNFEAIDTFMRAQWSTQKIGLINPKDVWIRMESEEMGNTSGNGLRLKCHDFVKVMSAAAHKMVQLSTTGTPLPMTRRAVDLATPSTPKPFRGPDQPRTENR